jgi:hypothetical protein
MLSRLIGRLRSTTSPPTFLQEDTTTTQVGDSSEYNNSSSPKPPRLSAIGSESVLSVGDLENSLLDKSPPPSSSSSLTPTKVRMVESKPIPAPAPDGPLSDLLTIASLVPDNSDGHFQTDFCTNRQAIAAFSSCVIFRAPYPPSAGEVYLTNEQLCYRSLSTTQQRVLLVIPFSMITSIELNTVDTLPPPCIVIKVTEGQIILFGMKDPNLAYRLVCLRWEERISIEYRKPPIPHVRARSSPLEQSFRLPPVVGLTLDGLFNPVHLLCFVQSFSLALFSSIFFLPLLLTSSFYLFF